VTRSIRSVTPPVTKRVPARDLAGPVPARATRWKLLSLVLAGVAGYSLLAHPEPSNAPAVMARSRTGAMPALLRRPLRTTAEAAGMSRGDLVDRVLQARSLHDVQTLTEKLGAVGDDQAVDQLVPLLADPRRGVPEAVLSCYGHIGTEHAVQMLLEHAGDDRPQVRAAAISALGSTQSERAEQLLTALAHRAGDPAQALAITALGALASDAAIAALIAIGQGADGEIAMAAVSALGSINSETATSALRTMLDAPDPRVAAAALTSIQTIDAPLLARLTTMVRTGDRQLGAAALAAMAKAGEPALPALGAAALTGNPTLRVAAVVAIGEIGGAKAIQALGDLLNTGDSTSAPAAAKALAGLGGKDARELLINAALGDRGRLSGALDQLALLDGDDVEQALTTVLKSGSPAERRAALPRVLKTGNPEAMTLAIDLARKGTRDERSEAMRLLAGSGAPKAYDALIDIAGAARGQTRGVALEMLAQTRPGDPALQHLLHDSLFSGRRDEASYAAAVLGRLGTEPARQTLMSALGGPDPVVSVEAASMLAESGMTDQIKTALLSAAETNPEIKRQMMAQLLQTGDPDGLRYAADILSHGEDDESGARRAILMLSSVGTPEAKQLIEHALSSPETAVRVAAITSLAHDPDDHATDMLVRLSRDGSAEVRTAALETLGQIGSDRAQQALFAAARSGATDDRVAAIGGLGALEDPATSAQLVQLIRDPDPSVARMAIGASGNAGPEVDQVLIRMINDPGADGGLKAVAAGQLRNRGAQLDPATEQAVEQLAGPRYGGQGYGGDVIEEPSEIEDRG
jgi:HEAT repeat protein